MEFSENLKEVRLFLGFKKNELAEKAGLTPSAITNFENGGRKPELESLIRLSKALGVSIDRLVFGNGDKSE
jgi:transcriptional regulator with XRE-family HTH domain